ncbi:MAG: sulfite exporter TauE/SafE family protein [Acidobacteriota bacterium]
MSPDLLVRIALILFLGGFIQSSAGFGFGLFALPLLLFMKLQLQEAVIMVIIGSAVQKILGIGYFRKVINLRELSPLIASGLTGLPIGLYLMFRVSGMHHSSIKQVIGFLIISMLVLRWTRLRNRVRTIKRIWTYIAGFFSGILNGFANIGGPPVVLWVLAQKWENQKMRATIISFSLFFVPFQIIIMVIIFGRSLYSPLLFSLILSPAVLLGSWIGLKFGDRFSRKILERYMEILLLLIAFASVLRPLLK